MTVWPAALVPESVELPACVFDCVEIVDVRFGWYTDWMLATEMSLICGLSRCTWMSRLRSRANLTASSRRQPDDRTRVARAPTAVVCVCVGAAGACATRSAARRISS